jgi:hypothetical protein
VLLPVLLPPGVPIKAPLVDGLAGTLYAMDASVRALVEQLPHERKAHPTVAILGGGGYIGARLVAVLAPVRAVVTKDSKNGENVHVTYSPKNALSLDVLEREKDQPEREHDDGDISVPDAICAIRSTTSKSAFQRIIALDTRFAGDRRNEGAVLYTAEAADLQAADVVLVITRNGNDVAEYIQHAMPGQVRMCLFVLPAALLLVNWVYFAVGAGCVATVWVAAVLAVWLLCVLMLIIHRSQSQIAVDVVLCCCWC